MPLTGDSETTATEASPEIHPKAWLACSPQCLRYLIFTLCAALYLLPFMRVLIQATGGDEGSLAYGAVRIVHGQVFARDFFEAMGPGTFYWLAAFNLIGVLRAHPVMTRVGSVAVFKDDPVLAFISTHVAAGEEMFVFPYYSMYCFLSAFSCKACETPRYVICRNEANCAADSTH